MLRGPVTLLILSLPRLQVDVDHMSPEVVAKVAKYIDVADVTSNNIIVYELLRPSLSHCR